MSLHTKFNDLTDELSSLYLERNEQVRGLILAILSGEHVLLLGLPGTAKSAVIMAIVKRLMGSRVFETQLTKFSGPEEVFGPTSVIGLQTDKFERVVDDYLPAVEFGYIDECFKANSAILNSFLSIMAERRFKNGRASLNCPLISLIGASNETPQDESLTAMYDRFMLKYVSEYVSDSNFPTLMKMRKVIAAANAAGPKVTLDIAELKQAQSEVEAVRVPDAVYDACATLRIECKRNGLWASDRRWMASEKILKACAYLDGRDEVTTDDLMVYKDILWDNMKDVKRCADIVGRCVNPVLAQIVEHIDQIDILLKEFVAKGGGEQEAINAWVKIKSHQEKLNTLNAGPKGDKMKSKIVKRVKEAVGKAMGF